MRLDGKLSLNSGNLETSQRSAPQRFQLECFPQRQINAFGTEPAVANVYVATIAQDHNVLSLRTVRAS
jgi:hypothetical protein